MVNMSIEGVDGSDYRNPEEYNFWVCQKYFDID
jgi:hypothetical protein